MYENDRIYISCKCSYKFVFIPFLSFHRNQKQAFLASWWSGNEKYFCMLFIASRALFQRYAEFNRLLEKDFRTCYSCPYYNSMIHYKLLLFSSGANNWCKNLTAKVTSRSCYVLPPSKEKDCILSHENKNALNAVNP